MDDPALDALRSAYAIPKNAIRDDKRMERMVQFFFWASGLRNGTTRREYNLYPQLPNDAQIGNVPTGDLIIWTGFSIIMLLIGIGILVFVQARSQREEC